MKTNNASQESFFKENKKEKEASRKAFWLDVLFCIILIGIIILLTSISEPIISNKTISHTISKI